jgi:hypothetical protein
MHKWEEDEREVTLEVECYGMPNSAHGERSNKGCDGCDGQWHDTSTPLPTKARHAAYRNTVTAQRTGDACAQMRQDGVALLKGDVVERRQWRRRGKLGRESQSKPTPTSSVHQPSKLVERKQLVATLSVENKTHCLEQSRGDHSVRHADRELIETACGQSFAVWTAENTRMVRQPPRYQPLANVVGRPVIDALGLPFL